MEETPGKNKKSKREEQFKKSLALAAKYLKETPPEEIEKTIKEAEEASSDAPPPYNLTYDQYLESLGLDPKNLDDEAWEKHKNRMRSFGIDVED